MSRRALLRNSAAAAAVVATAGGITACANGQSQASTAVQQPKTVISLRAWGVGSGATGAPKTIDALLYQATQPWRDKHPGVDVKIIENNGGPQAVIAAILAGDGPDVYHSWHPAQMFSSDAFTTDLTSYLRQENADLSVFNKAQMDLFVLPNGVRALPCYLGTQTLAVNQGLLDDLGLNYPEEGWTHTDYASLATQIAAGKAANSKARIYGADFGLGNLGANTSYLPPVCILEGFGASYVDPSDPTKCGLGSENSIAAVEWVYGLTQTQQVITGPGSTSSFTGGTLGMTWSPSFFLPQAATGYKNLNWKFYDMPSFPVTGSATGGTEDLYALNPSSPNIDLAWDLMYWICFQPDWQRSMMQIFLLSPALVSLWEEWIQSIPLYAPPLAGKNLEAFAKLAMNNHAYPQQFMRYSAPQADQLMDSVASQIWAEKKTVREGLTELSNQIDALELAGAAEQAAQQQTALELANTKAGGQYTAPPEKGQGNPYTDASKYVVFDKAAGSYTMLGDGWDIYNAEDACVFACLPETASTGDWICRITAVSNISCPSLSGWVKVGLMARADLSDDAAMVALHVTGSNSIEWETRPVAGLTPTSTSGLKPAGLKGSIMSAVSKPTPNFLTAPIWLKLHRDGDSWTPFASLDGTNWGAAAGISAAQNVQMSGCWMGIMVTAHNTDFSNAGYVRAVIDKVSFTPTKNVQLGIDGVPPAGGAVPADWATMVTGAPKASSSSSSSSASA